MRTQSHSPVVQPLEGEAVCLECGGLFASEPGPQLCGRCWSLLGRPSVWPEPAECEGHPAGPFDPMGETTYCDGSCVVADAEVVQ